VNEAKKEFCIHLLGEERERWGYGVSCFLPSNFCFCVGEIV